LTLNGTKIRQFSISQKASNPSIQIHDEAPAKSGCHDRMRLAVKNQRKKTKEKKPSSINKVKMIVGFHKLIKRIFFVSIFHKFLCIYDI